MAALTGNAVADPVAITGSDVTVYTDDDNPGGMAWFHHSGEHFGVCDRQADGYGVYGALSWYKNGTRQVRDEYLSAGSGHCGEWDFGDIEIAEGTTVYLYVALRDGPSGVDKWGDTDTGVA